MIKWFDSRVMKGLPELTSNQGDLVKMLTGLLVNGANLKPVTSISYTGGICTLNLGVGHGFVVGGTIDIQGSSQSAINKIEFNITLTTETTISFKCATPVTNETGLIVRYTPLGWTQYFASEGKSCYQSTNPQYPAFLRVDDTTYSGANTSAFRDANVEICANMTDFDTASWQSPYSVSAPLKNRSRVVQSDGWYKWNYAFYAASEPLVRQYLLWGDGVSFWLLLFPYGQKNGYRDRCSVVGMPLIDFGGEKIQSLVALDTSLTYDILDGLLTSTAGAKPVAPYLVERGSSFPTTLTGGAYTMSDLILRYPIFFGREKSLSGSFEGLGTTPSTTPTGSVVRSDGGIYKIISTDDGTNYSIALGGDG